MLLVTPEGQGGFGSALENQTGSTFDMASMVNTGQAHGEACVVEHLGPDRVWEVRALGQRRSKRI